jgi:hypothetical protein
MEGLKLILVDVEMDPLHFKRNGKYPLSAFMRVILFFFFFLVNFLDKFVLLNALNENSMEMILFRWT